MGKVDKVIKNKSKKGFNSGKVIQLKQKNKISQRHSNLNAFKKLTHTYNTMEILKKAEILFSTKNSPVKKKLKSRNSNKKKVDGSLLQKLVYIPDIAKTACNNVRSKNIDECYAQNSPKSKWNIEENFDRRRKKQQDDKNRVQHKRKRIPEFMNFTSSSKVHFYKINESQVLFIICHPLTMYFNGVFHIKVLAGEIDILGFHLDQHSNKQPVYSLSGTVNLSLKTKRAGRIDDFRVQDLLARGLTKEKVNEIFIKLDSESVVIVLEKDKSSLCKVAWPNLIEEYTMQTFLPSIEAFDRDSVEKLLQCTFEVDAMPDSSKNLYIQSPEWDSIMELLSKGNHRVAICGGKDVGKSTLLKYLINKSLTIWKSVLVIDCDPGQSEFFVPGCISAVHVKSPLLGPNFTHITNPEMSIFLGEVSVLQCSDLYMHSVGQIMKYCNSQPEFKDIPWFINTMGFNKGFGVVLTSTVIKKTSPSVVVQINSINDKSNFPSSLTPDFVETNLYRRITYNDCKAKNDYKLLEIDCAFERMETNVPYQLSALKEDIPLKKKFLPPVQRNIMILSYFGKLLNYNVENIFDVAPFSVDYTKLEMAVLNQDLDEDSVLDVINGNLVALCNRASGEDSVGHDVCLGFGIVRGISKKKKQLFLTTPLDEKSLSRVNCLIKGSVSLPDKIYTNLHHSLVGHVPYVMHSSNPLSHYSKRTFHSLSKSE